MRGKKHEAGYTLLEVMTVVVVLAVLAAIATPKYAQSAENAKKNADISTGHEIMAALDRYQVENSIYPKFSDMTADNGAVTAANFSPKYISKLDKTTTQQTAVDTKKGFGVTTLPTGSTDSGPTNLIMIYLNSSGSAAEVRVYDSELATVIWNSANQ